MSDTRYEDRCQLLHLSTLQVRRKTARAMTVANVLAARVDCPDILRQINLNAPSRTLRRVPSMHLPFRRTNYSSNSAIIGLQRALNRVSSVFDFHLSVGVLRYKFIDMLRQLLY